MSQFVLKYQHLEKLPDAPKALSLLQKIANMVKPIMKPRGFVLPLLSEMLPDNPGLLGLNCNAGEKILLRLRPHRAQHTFYDLDQLCRVMLHELTHNIHGPHDDKFYAYLKVLEDEFDKLVDGGFTGDGFYSEGKRVAHGHSHGDVSPYVAKQLALAKAEERMRKSKLMGPGGKLGGVKQTGKTPRELAADAAERRAKDDKTCGSAGHGAAEVEREVQKAQAGGVVDLASPDASPASSPKPIDLDNNKKNENAEGAGPSRATDPSSQPGPSRPSSSQPQAGPSFSSSSSSRDASTSSAKLKSSLPSPSKRPRLFFPSSPSPPPPSTASHSARHPSLKTKVVSPTKPASVPEPDLAPEGMWTCPVCTFLNSDLLPRCEICDAPPGRKHLEQHGWTCLSCAQTGNPVDMWLCSRCHTMKTSS